MANEQKNPRDQQQGQGQNRPGQQSQGGENRANEQQGGAGQRRPDQQQQGTQHKPGEQQSGQNKPGQGGQHGGGHDR